MPKGFSCLVFILLAAGTLPAQDQGPGTASNVEWVLPGRASSASADVRLGLPGTPSQESEPVRMGMPGQASQSEWVMPGRASQARNTMPGRAAWEPQESSIPDTTPRLDIENHVKSIALYPDVLLALTLAASGYPVEVAEAARLIRKNPDPRSLYGADFDLSVRVLGHCPDLLETMNQYLSRTEDLGRLFLNRPAEVLAAVQRLRASARAFAVLKSEPPLRVVSSGRHIRIESDDGRTLCLPSYDPYRIFNGSGYLRFGRDIELGDWAFLNIDWSRGTLVKRGWVATIDERSLEGMLDGYGDSREVDRWRARGDESRAVADPGRGAEDAEFFGTYEDGRTSARAMERGAVSRANAGW
jgi:hypothetical protein